VVGKGGFVGGKVLDNRKGGGGGGEMWPNATVASVGNAVK